MGRVVTFKVEESFLEDIDVLARILGYSRSELIKHTLSKLIEEYRDCIEKFKQCMERYKNEEFCKEFIRL